MSRADRLVTTRFDVNAAQQLAELERVYGVSAPELIRRGIAALYGLSVAERFPVAHPSDPGPRRGYRKPKEQAA